MSDKIFLDSNILIYCYTDTDLKKQSIARALATRTNACISMQVLNETTNILSKKYSIGWSYIENLITDFENNFFIHLPAVNDIRKACKIAERYKYSFYDSMIISSVIACDCSVLYSEDLHNSQIVENNIRIINPFL
jgi:predicted nucleic acid-binding protein